MSVNSLRFASVTILMINLLCNAPAEAAEDGRTHATFANSGGVYAGGAFDGVFGRLNTFRARPGDDINDRLQAGRDKALINVVQLNHGHRWDNDREEGLAKIKGWLERTDLYLVDAVHLAEEQPYNAAAWLDPLYDAIKAHEPTLPVYVWPSYPLGPMAKADGYVYDAYGEGYMASRRRLMSFLRTGKPLIMCIDASGFSDYRTAREQLMACHELDVPVFYFVADSGRGSYNNWYGRSTAALSICRNFMFSAMEFQRRCRDAEPITAGDMVWGEVIEVAPDERGTIDYTWAEFGAATVYGFTRLDIEDQAVGVAGGGEVALDFQFWSLLPVENAQLLLETGQGAAADGIQVAHSRCGKRDEWQPVPAVDSMEGLQYELGNLGQEFRLRVTLAGNAVLRGGHLQGRSAAPDDRAIALDAYYDGWRGKILFHQNLDVGLWRTMATIDNPQLLSEGRSLALRGKKGHGIGVDTVERFTSAYPLKDIVVRLDGMSHRALGGSFSLGLSLDGKTILQQGTATTKPREDGLFEGTYLLDASDAPDLRGIQSFYVHMTQKNNSGIRGNASSRLRSLQIDATRVE